MLNEETKEFLAAVKEGRPLPEFKHKELGPTVGMPSYAEIYAKLQVPIHPLGGKEPLTHNGFHDSTCDLPTVRRWWKRHPDAAIAARTGHTDGGGMGYDVIDVDGPLGLDWLRRRMQLGDMPEIKGHAITPRKAVEHERWGLVGGHHLYVPATGHGTHPRILPSIDYKAGKADGTSGGYVVLAPSKGKSGLRYTWMTAVEEWFLAYYDD